jgi:hypothetical protein
VTATVTATAGTTGNVGEQRRTTGANVKYAADDGERPRTMVDDAATVLKTASVLYQKFAR